MSPESFEGVRSEQTDIWSVGVVLYKLLTGRLPFPQLHPKEAMFAIITKEPEPMPPNIPVQLAGNRLQITGEKYEAGSDAAAQIFRRSGNARRFAENFCRSINLSQVAVTTKII